MQPAPFRRSTISTHLEALHSPAPLTQTLSLTQAARAMERAFISIGPDTIVRRWAGSSVRIQSGLLAETQICTHTFGTVQPTTSTRRANSAGLCMSELRRML